MNMESNTEAAQRTNTTNAVHSNLNSAQSTQHSDACESKVAGGESQSQDGDTCMLTAREENGDVILSLKLDDGFDRITEISPEQGYRFLSDLERALDLAAIAGEHGGDEA